MSRGERWIHERVTVPMEITEEKLFTLAIAKVKILTTRNWTRMSGEK